MSRLVLIGHIIICVVFLILFTSCFEEPPDVIKVYSLSDAEKKLAEHTDPHAGTTPSSPIYLMVYFDLGDVSRLDSDYFRLLEIIDNSGFYAELVLYEAKMGGTTVFTSPPLNEAVKGMDKIVIFNFPGVTTNIVADSNGMSPFYFYENLKRVHSDEKFAYIGDFAFSSCKNLEYISISSVKTVGKEAFRGCENLIRVGLSTVETIGDRAFYNCSALVTITMVRKPPTLGDSVFLGSTPAVFTLYIDRAYQGAYRTWIEENASKFNNDGKDVVFKLAN